MATTFRTLATCVLLLAAITLAPVAARAGGDVGPVSAPVPVANKFTGWWELGGYYGTDDSSRGEIVLFTPLAQSATTIFFLDARAKFFEEDVQEANLALGYRKMMPSGWNIGVWGGWDIRDTTNDNTFNQISFGFEALSERYDVRVNGYVPLEDSKGVSDTNSFQALLQGNNILVQGTNTDIDELAFYGVDAEFGILLFGGTRGGGSKGAPAPAGRHELRAYAGGFYFDNDDADDAIAGPKGRLEYRINDVIGSLPGSRLTIESELSYDEVRDTKLEIGARLRIPFGAFGRGGPLQTAYLSAQELRMTEGLERDTDIVTNEETETTVTTEGAIDDATDVALDNVSFAKTADQFAKAVNDGGNRLIILQKGNKRIDVSATDGQQLQDNQTVQGGASTILIRGKKTGEVVPFTAPGKRPTVFTNDDDNTDTGAITVANNTHVAGLNIRGSGGLGTGGDPGNFGVRGLSNLNNVVLEQLDIRQMGINAIAFDDDNSNLKIWNIDISDINSSGIDFDSRNANIVLSDIEISDVGDNGLLVGSSNRNITATNVRIVRSGSTAVNVLDNNKNFTFDGLTVISPGSGGVNIGSDNDNIKILNSTITDPDRIGIDIGFGSKNILIADTTITGGAQVMQEGIEIASESTVTIERVQISNAGFDGIEMGSLNVVSITDVTISDATFDGLQIIGNNNTVTMNNTTFNGDFGDEVIEIIGSPNTLDGTGNAFNGTFGNAFCDAAAGQNGSFGFPGGPSNCPP